MQPDNAQGLIEEAVRIAEKMSPLETDGLWLEDITTQVGPLIKEWDISACYLWTKWPDRETHFPNTTKQDIGIDAVAIRRSDGEHIAIQCKARKLDENGHGDTIPKGEIDKFANPSAADFWAERWLVTNGDNPMGENALQALKMHPKPIKAINIASDLQQQQSTFVDEECPHCEPTADGEEIRQTRSCMQAEAIEQSVRILKEHEHSESGGLPVGQARGKIILPCGTGKTRISLRIVEELTSPNEVSIVLCPSIALVAQIRREYLQHTECNIRALAVCSDETAGYDPKKEDSRNATLDPTVDNSNVSASEVKGKVTTDPAEISQWIRNGEDASQVSVIFGTYQSGHRIAQALRETGVTAKVLIADEAHRTAGLKRKQTKKAALSDEESRIRNFTLCHDQDEFPASRKKMGAKFPQAIKSQLQRRTDAMEAYLTSSDDEMIDFTDKNSIRPLFVALAELCLKAENGIMAMVLPTVALTAFSGRNERKILAKRFHIRTVLTSHQPGQINLSHNTGINESIIVAKRHDGPKPPTRFISLDRMPTDETEVADLHKALSSCDEGEITDGWGIASYWPSERVKEGDWTPAVWRSPELAEAAYKLANDIKLRRMDEKYTTRSTLQELYASWKRADGPQLGSLDLFVKTPRQPGARWG